MKIELDKEKKLNRQLRNEKSQIIVQRIELEQILAESINEVKKDIARRRNTKTLKYKLFLHFYKILGTLIEALPFLKTLT